MPAGLRQQEGRACPLEIGNDHAGGLKVGQVVGSSTSKGEKPADSPYRPENVLAMVYRHLGIDPASKLNDLSGRPRHLLEERRLVTELV